MDSLRRWPLPMIRFHRALLIAATVGVAVAASRVAADTSEVGSWILTAAFALLLLVADLAREVEQAAGSLADSSGKPAHDTRRDIYETRHSRSLPVALTIAILLFVASGVAYVWDGHHDHLMPRNRTHRTSAADLVRGGY